MSLKVPKNGQMQLFKEGYKVSISPEAERWEMLIPLQTDHVGSRGSRAEEH